MKKEVIKKNNINKNLNLIFYKEVNIFQVCLTFKTAKKRNKQKKNNSFLKIKTTNIYSLNSMVLMIVI